ncbi:hypothetical protein GCM10009805_16950 [Leucobacter chromiireducens subsp. solipictus]
MTTLAVTLASVLLLTGVGIAIAYHAVTSNIVRSDFTLPQVDDLETDPGEQNILIMGMDSRVDQNGQPLPEEIYDALHAGTADDGGYNANVLMLLHIPEDRSQTVGISIPRDDYVELAGAPLGITHSKIKEAYGLAMQERMSELVNDASMSDAERYQAARSAGRQAQIETVSHFLGDVRIDHFVEMTMGGFAYISQAVAPITVCLNQATEDVYSGANFVAGVQELDAAQAMSFVRQRRDTGFDGPYLTDLDRSRRQQAFLASVAHELTQRSTLTNPKTVSALVDVTQNHVALDTDFNVLEFLRIAVEASKSGARFVTLPIVDFEFVDGASVNTVDLDEVQGVVAAIFAGTYFAAPDAGGDPDSGEGAGSQAGAGEPGAELPDAGEPDAGEPAEAPVDRPEPPAPGFAVVETWDEPILAGSLPCVN